MQLKRSFHVFDADVLTQESQRSETAGRVL